MSEIPRRALKIIPIFLAVALFHCIRVFPQMKAVETPLVRKFLPINGPSIVVSANWLTYLSSWGRGYTIGISGDYDWGYEYDLVFRYGFWDAWALEAGAAYQIWDSTIYQGDDGKPFWGTDFTLGRRVREYPAKTGGPFLNAIYKFLPGGVSNIIPIVPYGGAGAGFMLYPKTIREEVGSTGRLEALGFGGLEFFLTPQIALDERFTVRYIVARFGDRNRFYSEKFVHGTIGAGVEFKF
ncbi:MAG: hypothetical protein ACUVXI_13050 [bacterium]